MNVERVDHGPVQEGEGRSTWWTRIDNICCNQTVSLTKRRTKYMAALELTPRDHTSVKVVIEQPRAETEKKARRTSLKLRRQLSVFGREHRAWKERHPCVVEIVGVLLGVLSLGLYFFDVVTDVLLIQTFFKYGHPGWGWMTVTFVAMPYLLAAVGVFNYYLGADSVQWENNEDGQTKRKRVVFFLFWLWVAGPSED